MAHPGLPQAGTPQDPACKAMTICPKTASQLHISGKPLPHRRRPVARPGIGDKTVEAQRAVRVETWNSMSEQPSEDRDLERARPCKYILMLFPFPVASTTTRGPPAVGRWVLGSKARRPRALTGLQFVMCQQRAVFLATKPSSPSDTT